MGALPSCVMVGSRESEASGLGASLEDGIEERGMVSFKKALALLWMIGTGDRPAVEVSTAVNSSTCRLSTMANH